MPSDVHDELRAECDAIFPIPGDAERIWLLRALALILDQIPWLRPYFNDDELEGKLQTLRERVAESILPAQRDAAVVRMGGDYGVADAVIGNLSPHQPKGILTFRGLLWLAARTRHRTGQAHKSSSENLASALRSISKAPASAAAAALDSVLIALEDASTLGEAINILDGLARCEHATLRQAWISWFKPALQEVATDRRERPPRPKPVPEPSGPVEIHPLLPKKRSPGQLVDEPPDECGGSIDLALVEGFGTGVLSRAQAQYRARQAIWGRNYLLLSNHIDALFPDVFGAALRQIVDQLERLAPSNESIGWLGCLLKGITGRSTLGIASVRVGAMPEQENIRWLHFDADEGTLSFAPYWKQTFAPRSGADDKPPKEPPEPAYFRPSQEQRAFLCPVSDRVILPLVAPIARALVRHQAVLAQLGHLDPSELEQWMAAAAAQVGQAIGLPLSSAGLRRSLAPLVMEACGDIAMAQLICGDSFGRPSAQQHYYAPRCKDVADVYVAATGQFFEEFAAPRLSQGAARVGSELLVQAASARRLAESSFQWKSENFSGSADRVHAIHDHRRILDHSIRMMLATAGHRWSSSIFELTLSDFDLRTGAALFKDKRHDIAHDPRLACLPKVVCAQLASYTKHVFRLAELMPELRDGLLDILKGGAPIFFDLQEVKGDRCEILAPSLESISKRGPAEWRVLPENWGRTYIRTRALEMGAPPFLIACQLGHLDAVGYPFSNQSPSEPLEIVRRLQPWLDRVAKTQGWAVIEGETKAMGRGARQADHAGACVRIPLKDWRDTLRDLENRTRRAFQQWETSLRKDAKQARDAAEKMVLAHPLLMAASVTSAYQDQTKVPRVGQLEELDLSRVRQDLVVECGDDAAAAIACVRALRHVLKAVAKRSGQPAPSVAIPIAVRRPLDNPFFAGACVALSQVHLLRDHVRNRARDKRPDRSFLLQVARTAEALMLFGGVDDAGTLMSILQSRASARSSAKIPDLLLVPLPQGRVHAFRGLAALALANLSNRFPTEELPRVNDIAAALVRLLPDWAGPAEHVIPKLCSTVAIANRFEYSPAACFAIDPVKGSVSASVDEQLAFIDGDTKGPVRSDGPGQPRGTGDKLRKSWVRESQQTAFSQYRKLVRMIPIIGRDFDSPLTGRNIAASAIRSAATRAVVVGELDSWLDGADTACGEPLWPIVRMLAEWTRAELKRVKPDGSLLEYRSIKTYLTRVGHALVQELGELDATCWSERIVEDAYQYALEASRDSRFKVAAALLSFHRVADARFELPEVDLVPLYAELGREERNVDSAMILPVERKAAFGAIAQHAWGDLHDQDSTRIARAADALAPFLGYGGLRLSEPMGLQVGDVGRRPSGVLWARVRSNRLRSLKTRSATRALEWVPACDAEHLTRTWQWTESVRKHAGSRRPEGVYLVSGLDARDDLREQQPIAQLIRTELARVTGRSSERLHRLRHLVATEHITGIALSEQDARWIGLPLSDVHVRPLQPRDLHGISVPMGHAHWMVTIQWYLHLPWVLQSRAAVRLRHEYFDRTTVAGVLGLTPFAVDNLLRGVRSRDPTRVWFDHVRPARVIPDSPTVESPIDAKKWNWTAEAVAKLVGHAWRAKDLLSAMALMGIPLAQANAIETYAARWERKLGLRVIPAHVGERRRECPARAARRMVADAVYEAIWRILDQGSLEQQRAVQRVVASFFEFLTPRSGDKLVLTRSSARELQELLRAIGTHDEVVLIELPGALVKLSLERPTARAGSKSTGLGLKRILAIAGLAMALQSQGELSNSNSDCDPL